VPAEALTRRVADQDNRAGKAYRVSIVTEKGPEQRIIRVGLQTRTQAEVTEGLNPGDRILLNRSQAPNGQNSTQRAGNNAQRFNRGPQL
jgi:hypothetical protein